MTDYYRYLWQSSWPSAVLLICLVFFVVIRLIWKGLQLKGNNNKRAKIFYGFKIVLWSGIVFFYLTMFLRDHKDWCYKPFFLTGVIEEKSYDQANNKYIIIVSNEEKRLDLKVNKTSYDYLEVNDLIYVMYLPVKQEVVSCEILARQDEEELTPIKSK